MHLEFCNHLLKLTAATFSLCSLNQELHEVTKDLAVCMNKFPLFLNSRVPWVEWLKTAQLPYLTVLEVKRRTCVSPS